MEKKDLLELFEAAKANQKERFNACIIDTFSEVTSFVSEGGKSLALQYLYDFIKQTEYLSDKRKLQYLEDLNIYRPVMSKEFDASNNDLDLTNEKYVFAQAIYEGQYVFYEILQSLKYHLKADIKQEDRCIQKISLKQIALKYIYEDNPITRDNGNEIANRYGYASGEKLYQYHCRYILGTDRNGDQGTAKKTLNQINLIESVLEFLPKDKQSMAKADIEVLTKYYNKYD